MSSFPKPIKEILKTYIKSVEGLENLPESGGYIIAANHNNHLDSFILSVIIQDHSQKTIKFLSRKSIVLWKIIGQWGADRLSAILVDHTKKGESLEVALNALLEGHIIGIYPEAQLNGDSQLIEPRSGTTRLALWTGFPIVPAGISEGPGAHRGLKLFNDIFFNFKNSTRVRFGKPLHFEKYHEKTIPKELLNQASNQIMNAIAPLCSKTYQNIK